MYHCERCVYSTKIKCNFIKHQNRKVPCRINQENRTQNGNPNDSNGNPNDSNGNPNDSNGNPNDSNGNPNNNPVVSKVNPIERKWIDIDIKYVRCVKCDKQLTKRCFKKHLDACRGVPKNTCKFCFRSFNKHQGCSKHQKICKRNPMNMDDDDNVTEYSLLDNQVVEPTITDKTNINANMHNTSTMHDSINIHGNRNTANIKTTNNFSFNFIGHEDLSHLSNEPNFLQKLKSYGKNGVYGVGKIISSIICDLEHPENNTLLKPRDFGSDVLVRGCDADPNHLEFRDISDALTKLKDVMMPRYLQYVCEYIRKHNINRLLDVKEKSIIRQLFHIMIVLDIDVPEELEHLVDIDDDKVDNDRNNDSLCNSHNTKLNKSVARSAYEFTKQNYKRKNGKYAIKS